MTSNFSLLAKAFVSSPNEAKSTEIIFYMRILNIYPSKGPEKRDKGLFSNKIKIFHQVISTDQNFSAWQVVVRV